jgi:tetratricopeptide (TPR) repeat protein
MASEAQEPAESEVEPSTSAGAEENLASARVVVEAPPAVSQREFEILAEIGRGGMGVVYLARQLSLGRHVALKMLPDELTEHEVALARFRREIRALGRCDHPNVVKVLSTGQLPDGRLYYAMEYVPGADLEHVWRELSGASGKAAAATLGSSAWTTAVLTASKKQREQTRGRTTASRMPSGRSPSGGPDDLQRSPLEPATFATDRGDTVGSAAPASRDPEIDLPAAAHVLFPPLPEAPQLEDEVDGPGYTRRVALLVRDAARALDEVHRQGIVHRDVKPSNLILTPDGGRVVLMDFGLAKGQSVTMAASRHAGFLGTLRYAAPEQLAAAKLTVGPAADVRGLGVTAWELLTRRRLFDEAEDESQLAAWVLNRDVPRLRSIDPSIDRDLEAIVARATERVAENRIQRAGELADYLDLYLQGKPLPIRAPGAGELLWRWAKANKASIAAAVLLLAALLAYVADRARQRLHMAELRALRGSFELALGNPAVTPEHWNTVESVLARMAEINANEAANSRQEFVRLFALRLERLINEQPRQDANTGQQFANAIRLVEAYSPEHARILHDALRKYERRPTLIADLEEAQLVRGDATKPFVSNVGAEGDLEVEVSFACEDWASESASLALDYVPGQRFRGYKISLLGRAAQPAAGFERLRIVREELLRDGGRTSTEETILRESELALKGGTVTLVVRRAETSLEVRLGDSGAPLRFRDVVPLERSSSGVIAWAGSAGVRATRLRASKFAAERRSPLEEADALLATGKFADALKSYEQLITATDHADLLQELRYKQARCYLGLRDEKSAIEKFDRLLHEQGELWPALAACDLCLLRLQAGQWDLADVALARLPHFIPEAGAGAILFDRIFGQIIRPYVDDRREVTRQMRLKPELVERLGVLFEVSEKLSELPRSERLDVLTSLSDACVSVGLDRLAERLLDRMLVILGDWRRRPLDELTGWAIAFAAHTKIPLLIRANRLDEAREFIQSFMPFDRFAVAPKARLLLERCRVLAARGQVREAREELQWVLDLRIDPDDLRIMGTVGTAAILRGFLSEDDQEALAIWKGAYERLKTPQNAGALVVAILGSLSRAMTDEDASQMIKTVAGNLGSQFPQAVLVMADFIGASEVIPALKDMWAFGRGRLAARDLALGRITGNDIALTQIPLTVAEIIRKGAFGGAPSAEVDELLWETMVVLFESYRKGELNLYDGTKLFMAWSGKLGWSVAAPRLEPRMSARIAYFVGCRLHQLNRPKEARQTFVAALKLCQGDEQLEKLIAAELAALGSAGQ